MGTLNVTACGPDLYRVTVDEGGGQTTHEVTVTEADVTRYTYPPGTVFPDHTHAVDKLDG